tara:strand:- start:631 stop:3342 length:2712 start_codon:yes stop_codon:yes gene_type:complete
MTQSNFKYSTGQAGKSLFEPKKESKPFQPFDIQAASQPILNALKENKEVEVENLQRTGNYGLESMRIEHANAQAVASHNATVAKLNDEYDFEQLTKFSKGAQQLVAANETRRQEESKKWAYTKLLAMPAKDRAILIEKYSQLTDENDKFIDNAASGIILDTLSSPSSRIIAEDMLRATGYRRKALFKATFAERVARIPQMMNHLYSEVRLDDPKYPKNPTINELREHQKVKNSGNLTSDDMAYSDALQAKIAGQMLERNFIPHYDAKEIYTKVQPVLDQYHGDTVQDILNENERRYQANLIEDKYQADFNSFQLGAANKEVNIAQEITDRNHNMWAQLDENGFSGATQKSLIGVLELVRADKISTIEAREVLDQEIEVKGQCHIKKDGKCFTTLRLWRGKDIAAVDFENELLKIGAKEEGIKKLDYEGMITYAKDNLQELFANSLNKPIDTPTMEKMVDLIYKRVGGRRSDIAKELYESVDTVQGLTDEKGLEILAQKSDYGKRPQDPKDYQHISHAAMLKAHEKGYLTASDSYLSKSELKTFDTISKPIGINLIAGEGGTEIQAALDLPAFQENARLILEANYYHELRTNPTLDKSANLAEAKTKTLKFLADEKNLETLKGPRLENAERAAERNRHVVELRDAGTNQVALSGFKERIKLGIKEIMMHRGAGNTDSPSKLISTTYLREDGTTGVFFDDNWRAAARAAQQSPEKFLETQLRLNGYNEKTNVYTVPEGDNKIKEGGGPGAKKRVDTNNTHLDLEAQLEELKANKPKPEQAGDEFMGKKVKPAKYRTPDGRVITPERDPGGLMAWEEKVKALEEKIKREEEAAKDLIGEKVGDVKDKLPETFGYPISWNKEMLKRLGFKDQEIITEDMLAHLSRRSDLLFNPDTPFPEYTYYGGIG